MNVLKSYSNLGGIYNNIYGQLINEIKKLHEYLTFGDRGSHFLTTRKFLKSAFCAYDYIF